MRKQGWSCNERSPDGKGSERGNTTQTCSDPNRRDFTKGRLRNKAFQALSAIASASFITPVQLGLRMPTRLWYITESPTCVAMIGVGTKMEVSSAHETLKIVMYAVSRHRGLEYVRSRAACVHLESGARFTGGNGPSGRQENQQQPTAQDSLTSGMLVTS